MCGRYASIQPAEALQRIFRTGNPLPNIQPAWNIAPTQAAPVVRRHPETDERHLDLLSWGLLPHWMKSPEAARRPINARAETLATSPMFRDAFARRRCLVPADAFYEWKALDGGKQPYGKAGAPPMASCCAVSPSSPSHRMGMWPPCMTVCRRSWRQKTGRCGWARLKAPLPPLLRPPPNHLLRVWPVSRAVNSPRNDGPELLTPVASG